MLAVIVLRRAGWRRTRNCSRVTARLAEYRTRVALLSHPADLLRVAGNWRNVILTHALDMVHFGALTLAQFVYKSSTRPAQMIGLASKGHLTPGADADLVLVDLDRKQTRMTVAGGQVIYDGNGVVGTGGMVVTTREGAASLRERGLPHRLVDLAESLFYAKGRQVAVSAGA
jgi:N-acyl-D-aspartate/D-glutamate deacylase